MKPLRKFWRESLRPWWYDYEWPVMALITFALVILDYYGFLLQSRFEIRGELLARLEHERWLSERLIQGWDYGPTRHDELRLNPNLRAWNLLPETVREFNRRVAINLPGLLARAGLQVKRSNC